MASRSIPPDVQKWFDEYNQHAARWEWPRLSSKAGQGSWWQLMKRIEVLDETLPTWDELNLGWESTKGWNNGPMRPSNGFWILKFSGSKDRYVDERYPNILMLRNWGRGTSVGSTFREFTG